MYQITCDGYVLHDTRIDEFNVINPKCSLEVNKTGSLTFEIAPTHPYYDVIKKHTSEITLYQDNRLLFCGRVLNDEIGFDNIKVVECEGELSYFIDTIQRGKEYHLEGGNENVIETYLKDIVAIHNSQVDERKRFSVGTVTVTDPNNYLYKISNYDTTLSCITDKLINTYGGYIITKHKDGVKYIDYVNELTNACNQTIEFGKNIVDMKRCISGEDIFTAIIPLGKKAENNTSSEETVEKRLTIASLPNGTDGTIKKVDDYIYDTEAVEKWGWIWKVETWDDVEVASNLLSNAKALLRDLVNETLTIELTAIDLHLLDVNIDSISVGDLIQCISIPHNLNTVMVVQSMNIDINNPTNTNIKLSLPDKNIKSSVSITSNNVITDKSVVEVKQTIDESIPTRDDVAKMIDSRDEDIKYWVSDNFYPASGGEVDLHEYAKVVDVNNAFSELATALEGV